MVEDRKRCGWSAVLAAVALCAALLLAVPPARASAADGPVPVVVRHTADGGAEVRALPAEEATARLATHRRGRFTMPAGNRG